MSYYDAKTPIEWNITDMLEVRLLKQSNFLKVIETLTRMGIVSEKDKTVYQSCHILHKKGRYYIVHFKELYGLDGREITLTEEDIARRNAIAALLEEWELIEILDKEKADRIQMPKGAIRIIKNADKENWNLKAKYKIGKVHNYEK